MRIYENLFIVKPDATEEEIDHLIEQMSKNITTTGGTVDKVDKWGKRRLAYRVEKQREGYYVLLTFTADSQAVRSARGRRGSRLVPSTACAGGALHADESNALGLTTHVHRLGNVSGSAAARAVFRIHSSPSVAKESFTNSSGQRQKVDLVTKNEQIRAIRGEGSRARDRSDRSYFDISPMNTP
jgi:small subunit ribosomal protein S6